MLYNPVKKYRILKQETHYQKRTMYSFIKNTSTKVITQRLPPSRNFAAIAAKSKTIDQNFDQKFLKHVYNNHAQYVTDFNIIYEDPKDIRLYSIASLHTTPVENSVIVSNNQNYKLENKPQQIQFHEKPVCVTADLHIVKKSQQYFEKLEIKGSIENTEDYKKHFDSVIAELKKKQIKYKLAQTEEDFNITGYHLLLNKYKLQDKNALLETLPLSQHDKE